MRILITGAAGFIGSHVAEHLSASGATTHLLDDLSTGSAANLRGVAPTSAPFSRVDVTSPSAARLIAQWRPSVVVHLAAQTEVVGSMRDPVADARANVLGLVNIAAAAAGAGCRKIIFSSSGGTIYGDPGAAGLPVSEGTAKQPQSFYGLSKLVGGLYLDLFSRHSPLEHATLALGNVYGPRQSPTGEAGVVAIFADRMATGRDCVINGDGRTTRDFIHVADVCSAVEKAVERGTGLINVGTGVETSVLDAHRTLARETGVTRAPVHGPALTGEVRRIALDPARAARELGWQPQVPFAEGIRRMLATRAAV